MLPARSPRWRTGAARKDTAGLTATGGRNSGRPSDLMWPSRSGSRSGLLSPAEVFEEPHPVRQVPQLPGLLSGHPGGEEVLYPSRIVEEGDHPVAGSRQRPGGVQDPLQHRVQVEALVDAEAGLAQPGQPVPQRRYLPVALIGVLQLFTPHSTVSDPLSRVVRTRLDGAA